MASRMTHFGYMSIPSRLLSQKGSVLATVLLVLVILLGIFLSAMTYALSRYGHHIGTQNKLVASHLSEAGVCHQIDDLQRYGARQERNLWSAPNRGKIRTRLHAWGPYFHVISEGEFANKTVLTSALIGSAPPDYMDAALTVGDPNSPLVVAGHTRILGDVITGHQGVMPGRFRGESVVDNFLRGTNHKFASPPAPRLDTNIINLYFRELEDRGRNIEQVLSGSVVLGAEDSDYLEDLSCVRVENNLVLKDISFRHFGEIKSFFVGGSVDISGSTRLSGLIEMVTDKSIRVTDSAVIDHAILWAGDRVEISDNARFSGIAISGGRIIVSDNATLEHPSLLLADTADAEPTDTTGIYLISRGQLESVCYLRDSDRESDVSNRMLYLDTTVGFKGFMLSEGYADLRGRVFGSAAAKLFHYAHAQTTYLNWVKDLYISRARLDYTPGLPVLQASDSTTRYLIVREDRID